MDANDVCNNDFNKLCVTKQILIRKRLIVFVFAVTSLLQVIFIRNYTVSF